MKYFHFCNIVESGTDHNDDQLFQMIELTSSQASVTWCIQFMKTFNLLYTMTSRRNPWTAALLMIIIKALSSLSLTCHPAEYQIGKECCPLCSAGTRVKIDCTEDRSTSCLPCIKGTYMDNPTGRKECFSCTNCDAGSGLKVKRSCTVTSDAVCEPMEGFYCIDYKGDKCEAAQRHTSCKPGQYIQVNGTAYRDTECSDCSDGTFSDGTLTSCQPHRQCEAEKLQLIKAGTPSDDAQCGETTTNVGVTVGVIITVLVLCAGLFVAFIFYKRQKPYHPAANGDNPIERNHRVSADRSTFCSLQSNCLTQCLCSDRNITAG